MELCDILFLLTCCVDPEMSDNVDVKTFKKKFIKEREKKDATTNSKE